MKLTPVDAARLRRRRLRRCAQRGAPRGSLPPPRALRARAAQMPPRRRRAVTRHPGCVLWHCHAVPLTSRGEQAHRPHNKGRLIALSNAPACGLSVHHHQSPAYVGVVGRPSGQRRGCAMSHRCSMPQPGGRASHAVATERRRAGRFECRRARARRVRGPARARRRRPQRGRPAGARPPRPPRPSRRRAGRASARPASRRRVPPAARLVPVMVPWLGQGVLGWDRACMRG
jgi:hypothetical protein